MVPVDNGAGFAVFVEEEGGAVVATPGVVAGYEVETDVVHVGADGLKFVGDMVGHGLVVDVDMDLFAFGEGFDEEVIGGIDGFYLSGPGVGVLGIGEPGGLVAGPFCGHEIALFFGGAHFQ